MDGYGEVRLTIDLDLDASPVRGRVWGPADQGRAFDSWLDLVAALDGLIDEAKRDIARVDKSAERRS